MASAPVFRRQGSGVEIWGFLVLSLLSIGLDRWSKGSSLTIVVRYLFLIYVSVWFSLKIRTGYLRRRPYWTRESWQRFLRLMAMPVGALVVLFTILYFFDPSTSTFGSPQSATRIAWTLVMLALLGFGAIGLPIAVDWLGHGEPSEQFTRTRFFRRRGSNPIAD
jgi:hypothetical protein